MIYSAPNLPAIDRAKALYADFGFDLAADIGRFLDRPGGVVVKRLDLLLLARPADRANPSKWVTFGEADGWYVHLLVGRPVDALECMPRFLPWILFHRNFRLHGGPLHALRTELFTVKLRK